MKTSELVIEGMSCGHCVMSLKKELSKIKDLNIRDVQIGKAEIDFDENKVSSGDLSAAVEEAGFKLVAEKTL